LVYRVYAPINTSEGTEMHRRQPQILAGSPVQSRTQPLESSLSPPSPSAIKILPNPPVVLSNLDLPILQLEPPLHLEQAFPSARPACFLLFHLAILITFTALQQYTFVNSACTASLGRSLSTTSIPRTYLAHDNDSALRF